MHIIKTHYFTTKIDFEKSVSFNKFTTFLNDRFNYVLMKTLLKIKNDVLNEFYIDIKCIMLLINRDFLFIVQNDYKIIYIETLICVKNIKLIIHDSFKYVIINFYILYKNKNEKKVIIHFIRELYIVNILKVKILIEMNILSLEEINIMINFRHLIIINYENFIAFLIVNFKS